MFKYWYFALPSWFLGSVILAAGANATSLMLDSKYLRDDSLVLPLMRFKYSYLSRGLRLGLVEIVPLMLLGNALVFLHSPDNLLRLVCNGGAYPYTTITSSLIIAPLLGMAITVAQDKIAYQSAIADTAIRTASNFTALTTTVVAGLLIPTHDISQHLILVAIIAGSFGVVLSGAALAKFCYKWRQGYYDNDAYRFIPASYKLPWRIFLLNSRSNTIPWELGDDKNETSHPSTTRKLISTLKRHVNLSVIGFGNGALMITAQGLPIVAWYFMGKVLVGCVATVESTTVAEYKQLTEFSGIFFLSVIGVPYTPVVNSFLARWHGSKELFFNGDIRRGASKRIVPIESNHTDEENQYLLTDESGSDRDTNTSSV